MAQKLKVNDLVYVPCKKFKELESNPTAFYRTKIVDVNKNSIKVDLPNQGVSPFFGMSLAHKTLGLLIVNIGDFDTEGPLLDPLAKSVLQYTRLLLPDDALRYVKLRTLSELKLCWEKHHAAYSHLVIIGHGGKDGIKFGVDGQISAEVFQEEILRKWGGEKKTIISLCCKTGYKSFGGKLSSYAQCKSFIGPYHSIHGAVASQFFQTFFAHHLLEGKTVKVAFNNARDSVPGSTSFRLWENNQLSAGAKS